MSDEESEAFRREVVAEIRERKARRKIEPEPTAGTADQPPGRRRQDGNDHTVPRCPSANRRWVQSARLSRTGYAVDLRERYLAPTDAGAAWRREATEEDAQWMLSGTEEADRDLLDLLDVDYESL